MEIRAAGEADLDAVLAVERAAFGQEDEAALTRDLLADRTIAPLSLLAEEGGTPVGHVLFTPVTIHHAEALAAAILAPLAVAPEAQGRGVGRALVEEGFRRLEAAGVALVFVLGDPDYYGRFGFTPAKPHELEAPYRLPKQYADAWMVRALRDGVLGSFAGRVRCAAALNREELWRE